MSIFAQRRASKSMQTALSYEAWRTAAGAHDEATGEAKWKLEEQTRIYDYAAIRARLDQLRYFRERGDDHGLLFALNEGIHGNMGRMGALELYERAKLGTKKLITDYLDAQVSALQHLAKVKMEGVSEAERLDFFRRASLCFGRSALLLSGGGVYGNFHVGVVKVLIEQDLLPGVISGASAGSLIAAIVGTHSRADLLTAFNVNHLQVQARRPARKRGMGRLLPSFDPEDIYEHIARLVPDLTFAEAYQRTGIYINISVSPAEVHQTPRLMNAITSPNVYVRSAVRASCAVPGIFPPVALMAKNRHGEAQAYLPGRRWVDGSVSDDVPARRLSRLYAVNHYIVSQVNPFALLHRPAKSTPSVSEDLWQFLHHTSKNAARVAQGLSNKYGRRWPELRYNMNVLMSVLMQDYGGDINILPPAGLVQPWKGMSRPSEALLSEIISAGERATWPQVEMIRNSTRIGRVLDQILQQLENSTLRDPRAAVKIDWNRWAHATTLEDAP